MPPRGYQPLGTRVERASKERILTLRQAHHIDSVVYVPRARFGRSRLPPPLLPTSVPATVLRVFGLPRITGCGSSDSTQHDAFLAAVRRSMITPGQRSSASTRKRGYKCYFRYHSFLVLMTFSEGDAYSASTVTGPVRRSEILSQPFFVPEIFTGSWSGNYVKLARTPSKGRLQHDSIFSWCMRCG